MHLAVSVTWNRTFVFMHVDDNKYFLIYKLKSLLTIKAFMYLQVSAIESY